MLLFFKLDILKIEFYVNIANVKFNLNLILLKLSFKNNDILLNNFKIEAFCCLVCKLGTDTHFPPLWVLIAMKKHSFIGLNNFRYWMRIHIY